MFPVRKGDILAKIIIVNILEDSEKNTIPKAGE